jgi:hypothetical protein
VTPRQKIELAMAASRAGRVALRWIRDRRRARQLRAKLERADALMAAAHQLEKRYGRRAD